MKQSILLFLAREHGLATLRTIVEQPSLAPLFLFTHRLIPQGEKNGGRVREEFALFNEIAREKAIPLISIDDKEEQKRAQATLRDHSYDLILAVSWRRHLPKEIFGRAKIGAINLHRGDLPRYPGREPIRRALEAGEREGAITAHIIEEEIDSGPILCKEFFPLRGRAGETIEQAVERIKREITPLFPVLAMKAIALLLENKESGDASY